MTAFSIQWRWLPVHGELLNFEARLNAFKYSIHLVIVFDIFVTPNK